ncbi:MAG: HYC_CC_PP family protein, partial [Bacteroidota bacterium]
MMKKIAAILFSMFYLLVTAGTAFSIHYCHGMVKDIEVFSHSQKSCCGPQACSTDCCEDVLIYVQLDDEQISKQNIRDLI